MCLVINKWVTAVKVSHFSGHYLRNRSTLDIGVLTYIGIVQHKEHSPEVLSIPPGTPCIYTLCYHISVLVKLITLQFRPLQHRKLLFLTFYFTEQVSQVLKTNKLRRKFHVIYSVIWTVQYTKAVIKKIRCGFIWYTKEARLDVKTHCTLIHSLTHSPFFKKKKRNCKWNK